MSPPGRRPSAGPDRPQARHRYGEIAIALGLPGRKTAERIDSLVGWLDGLKRTLGIPSSIQEAGVDEATFLGQLEALAEGAFDDQCTGTNPRFPLLGELRQILLDSYLRPGLPGIGRAVPGNRCDKLFIERILEEPVREPAPRG